MTLSSHKILDFFSLSCKSTNLKQQTSFFQPILSTDASSHIYATQRLVKNAQASFCA